MTTATETATDRAARERILEGALLAFQARGIRAVSTTDLARELGVSKSTLYQHFPTKEALVREVLFGILERVWVQSSSATRTAKSSRAAMRAYFETAARLNAAYPPGALHDVAREYPALLEEFGRMRAERLAELTRHLERAQANGELRADLDVPAVMRVLQTLVDTMTTPEFQARSGLTPQTVPLYIGSMIDGFYVTEGK